MGKANHTPGPWRVDDHPRREYPRVTDARGRFVSDCEERDARLIAAAPDMLDALRDALEFVADQEDVSDGPDGQQVPNRAMSLAQTLRAVIEKAGGVA